MPLLATLFASLLSLTQVSPTPPLPGFKKETEEPPSPPPLTSQDIEKGLERLRKSAQTGDVEAIFFLANYHFRGNYGVPIDQTKAVSMWLQAAEKGHSSSQFNLALAFEKGTGTAKNLSKALYWFTKAAEQNHTKALYKCGQMHEEGIGTPKSMEKAIAFYTKAADLSYEPAKQHLRSLKGGTLGRKSPRQPAPTISATPPEAAANPKK